LQELASAAFGFSRRIAMLAKRERHAVPGITQEQTAPVAPHGARPSIRDLRHRSEAQLALRRTDAQHQLSTARQPSRQRERLGAKHTCGMTSWQVLPALHFARPLFAYCNASTSSIRPQVKR